MASVTHMGVAATDHVVLYALRNISSAAIWWRPAADSLADDYQSRPAALSRRSAAHSS